MQCSVLCCCLWLMCTTLFRCWVPFLACPRAGLQKLLEQKDNHVFRGLSRLASPGCTFKDAVAGAGVDCCATACMHA